jgi:hypothetical protein
VATDVKGNITTLPANLRPAGSTTAMNLNWDSDNKLRSADIDANGTADVNFQYDGLDAESRDPGRVARWSMCNAYPGRRFALPWAISFCPFGGGGSMVNRAIPKATQPDYRVCRPPG